MSASLFASAEHIRVPSCQVICGRSNWPVVLSEYRIQNAVLQECSRSGQTESREMRARTNFRHRWPSRHTRRTEPGKRSLIPEPRIPPEPGRGAHYAPESSTRNDSRLAGMKFSKLCGQGRKVATM